MSQAAAAGAFPPDMIRPERISGIPMLSQVQKVHYTEGLTKLWAAYEGNPPGSEHHNKAMSKIKEVSKELMRQISNWKANTQRPQSQGQPQLQQQQQQPSQHAHQQQQHQQQPQPPPSHQQPQQQQQPSQTPDLSQSRPPMQTQPSQQPQVQAQSQPQSQPNNVPFSQQAKSFIASFKVFPAPGIQPNTPDYENHKRRIMSTLTSLVTMQESSMARFQNISEKISALEKSGQPVPPEVIQGRESARAGLQQAQSKIETVRNENEKNRMAWMDKNKNQTATSIDHLPPTQQPPPTAAYNPQVNNPRQPMSPQVGTPYQTQNPNLPQQQQQQQQHPQQQQQHPQQPIARPQPNPQQPYHSPAHQGPPQPLSHQAAIAVSNRTYSEAQQLPQGTPTPAGGQPFTQTPNSSMSVNQRFSIPKTLPPQSNSPVALGPARPTFGGPTNGAPGMMGQPAIQKNPGFILEGEGDRVLSKKKLDELVRQVTGGGERDNLTPDVEEAVLALADDFVDNVITAACRLAKIRPNSTLDIRDIQMILERNYNIRVPGYSLDEIRTVRKFQPAPGWTQKMNAVQAAKVMGKNDS